MNVRNRFFGLAGLHLDMFYNRGEEALPFLVKSSVSKIVWLSIYKGIEPIETISRKERWELYKYVISTFPLFDRIEKREAAIIIYTIGNML